MNNTPLVSIAMCTYNGDKYIIKQINSILSQSYSNLELIIIDDCSTDNTMKLLTQCAEKDKRIHLYQNNDNLGFVKNFEKAISQCQGKYIALADQDDIWKRNKLEYFLTQIQENILIYSDALLMNETDQIFDEQLIRPNGNLVDKNCNKAFLFFNCVSGNTMMFKKELIKDILPIPEIISFHDIWIAFVASTVGSIKYVDKPMTYYRRHDQQVTRTKQKLQTTFRNKLKMKEEKYKNVALTLYQNFKAFRKMPKLDQETKILLDLLIDHYENFQDGYFNFQLFRNLYRNKDEVFAIKKKQYKYIFRYASKNKLLKALLYSI